MHSYWIQDCLDKRGSPLPMYPKLEASIQDTEYDVAIIGGGWFGLITALKLHDEGKKVIVLEGDKIGYGTAGLSSGILSSYNHDLFRHYKDSDEDVSMNYGCMSEDGIDMLENIIQKYNIDCDWKRTKSYIYAPSYIHSPQLKDMLEEYAFRASRYGLTAHYESRGEDFLDRPITENGVIELQHQAVLNPFTFLTSLADILYEKGVPIHENTRVNNVNFTTPFVISTIDGFYVKANKFVLATHLPFLDRTAHFARCNAIKSYSMAFTLKKSRHMIHNVYISSESDKISFRPTADGKVLIFSGVPHTSGEIPSDKPQDWGYEKLSEWIHKHFPVDEEVARWSGLDYFPADHRPYIGTSIVSKDSSYMATGFGNWGLAQGAMSAHIVANLILGKPNKFGSHFNATRLNIDSSLYEQAIHNLKTARHLITTRIEKKFGIQDIEDLAPGQGGICHDQRFGTVAAYNDEHGHLHKFMPDCTHLGCLISWNQADKSFDCPCHGSRYGMKGEVLHGPAVHALKKIE